MRLLVALALVVLAAAPAAAQQVEIQKAPAPPRVVIEREPGGAPTGIGDATRPSDGDVYPRGTNVPYAPSFVRGLSSRYATPTSTGHAGVAAWTSPNTPVGGPVAGWREVSGWFGLGFAVTWDGPPPEPARRPAN
ncbi:MAG: hypothetical protein A3E31_18355 [Candidatus Rokubacteria bacterium RIFCSPHIGHO2_12_FULL_73_22]|nr:MAG: hypothetical protein A3D33_15420 [Candidatus Rokubacteria bacterium RIFCSPHIGHO2_02_FULL_73_26]OGK99467.1 MAG: hypothetical protein A3E31_18355 [Candidatus Rokubacteria bacterium RIFCSPHIGHO2_12_FULL_73_22]OGL13435.1 MAG: hypothetical protein A3I14_18355 [Candidatus Rokubacteria bacterium RIFCSPLOWO2_02_FULL_73_56]OGL27379.1 MAG: hypothetical protein A3G44_14385 [Candidatus Rokubacteria bacterium RIFCSPLOWO2_12_FULL_73_47]